LTKVKPFPQTLQISAAEQLLHWFMLQLTQLELTKLREALHSHKLSSVRVKVEAQMRHWPMLAQVTQKGTSQAK
jgi:hypothetical protein